MLPPIPAEKDIPYITAIIKLAEGPHFLINIVGCGSDEVYCDMPLEVTWEDVDGAFSLPKFKPDADIGQKGRKIVLFNSSV